MTTNKREEALRILYKQLREAKISLGYAESKTGVKQEELDNLQRKIVVLDWMIPLVLTANEEDK